MLPGITPVDVVPESVPVVVVPVPPAPVSEPIVALPEDHKPINTIPENSEGDRKAIEITGWQKFETGLFGFLNTLPWVKLFNWASSKKD